MERFGVFFFVGLVVFVSPLKFSFPCRVEQE